MTIRALDFLLSDKKLVREAPLTALRDARLGIDAQVYVRRLLSSTKTKEPLVPALGGVPLALEEHITREMRILQNVGIKPVFVFPGLAPPKRERPLATGDTRPAKRQAGWEAYEKGRSDVATMTFASVPIAPVDVFRAVHRTFHHRKTEFVIAPYVAWAQLVYLERSPKHYTHATWSTSEFLMFPGVDKLIVNVDFEQQTFSFISKNALLEEIGLTSEQFLDVCVMAGFDSAPSIPLVEWSFKAVIDLVKQHGNGARAVIAAMRDNPAVQLMDYAETFARAQALVKCSIVMSAEGSDRGRVMPLPLALPIPDDKMRAEDIPSDLADVFSHRLSDEVYFQVFRGLLSPSIVAPLATGYWVEQAPLCGGESPDYIQFLEKIVTLGPQSPRRISLALISSCLEPFWQKRQVNAIFYYDPSRNFPINHSNEATLNILERTAWWNVPLSVIQEELRRQGSSTIDIRLCLGATAEGEQWAGRTRIQRGPHPLEKRDEIVANTLWRFLELRGFLGSNHMPLAHGKALYKALKVSRVNDKFQEPLYLAIELIRAGVLHSRRYGNKTYSGGPNLGGEEDKANAMLVMRVLSIVPLNFKAEAWAGPVSRSLLVFNSFLRTLSRSLRSMLEALSCHMLLKGDAKRDRDDFMDITLSLPFRSDTNTGMGVLWKGWCDACSMIGTQMQLGTAQELGGFVSPSETISASDDEDRRQGLENVKQAVSGMLEGGFNNVRDVRHELARGVRFWDTVVAAVRMLKAEKSLEEEMSDMFESANRWLEPFRP